MDLEKILEKALNTMDNMNENYLHSFAMDENFKGKRFSRFVTKAKLDLFEYVKKNTPAFHKIYHHGPFKITNIDDYIFANIVIYVHSLNENYKKMTSLLHLFHLPEIPSVLIAKKDLEELKDVFIHESVIYKMIHYELENTYQEHIAYLSAKNSNINEINYVRELLPFSDPDQLKILNEAFYKIIVSFEHLILINEDYKGDNNEELLQTTQQMYDYMFQNEKLEEKNEEQNQLIEKLKKDLQKKNEETRLLVKRNTEELRKENYELLKNNEELKEKLKKQTSQEISTTIEEEIIEKKCDSDSILNKDIDDYQLLFIISDRCTFLKELQKAFPTARITFKNYENSISKSDYVVVFTNYVNHTTYYHVKEICKQTNTNLLHCRNSNIERIKELLIEKI